MSTTGAHSYAEGSEENFNFKKPFTIDDLGSIKEALNIEISRIDNLMKQIDVTIQKKDDRIAELEKCVKEQAIVISQLRDIVRND